MNRRKREGRAYALVLTTTGAAVAAVVFLVLAVIGVASPALFILAALVAGGAGFAARRTLNP